ncbi:NAD-binding protein [Candidatus Methanomethylophilus sp. 1R26]|uniref:NAD-binding protein n=1 Tax=Candidatus Methanomethylophilus sp. 1R26 TaxID=1769296 RepID=UPI0012FF4881|nr:NAD-binding protein [Candidatus Methanomethylophilus sp. 1R26]
MKVIIVGAGEVGLASAQAAKKDNDVLIIDKDPARTENAKNSLQVSVLREDGSNPTS